MGYEILIKKLSIQNRRDIQRVESLFYTSVDSGESSFYRRQYSYVQAYSRHLSNTAGPIQETNVQLCGQNLAVRIEMGKVMYRGFENHIFFQHNFGQSRQRLYKRLDFNEGYPIQVYIWISSPSASSSLIETDIEMCQADETD